MESKNTVSSEIAKPNLNPQQTIQAHLKDKGCYRLKALPIDAQLITGLEWWNLHGMLLILQLHIDGSYELFIPASGHNRNLQADIEFLNQMCNV